MHTRIWMGIALSLLGFSATSHAQVIDKKALSLTAAKKIENISTLATGTRKRKY